MFFVIEMGEKKQERIKESKNDIQKRSLMESREDHHERKDGLIVMTR